MNQSLKAMMVAGVVAMGLSALTAPADAQPVPGWNLLMFSYCVAGSTGTSTYLDVSASTLNTSNNTYTYALPTIVVQDERQAIVVAQYCAAGTSIYGWYSPNSNPAWGPFSFGSSDPLY
jgi:hypothetical protein